MADTELGCETHTVYLYKTGGTERLYQIVDVAKVEWGRVIDDISEATITISTTDDPECCYWLGQVDPWRFEIVIFRGAERVWEGPIWRVKHTRSQVTLICKDLLIWASKIAHRGRITGGMVNAMDEWELMLLEAFSSYDPHFFEYFTRIGTAPNQVDRDVKRWSKYYSDDLIDLARNGFGFTVAGRRPILVSDDAVLGELQELSTGEHILAEVEVTMRGDDFATHVMGVNSAGQTIEVENMDTYLAWLAYGKQDYILTVDGEVSLQGLTYYANEAMFQSYPMPWSVTIPNGSQLAPSTPWGINQMIPGVQFPVKVQERLCVEFHRDFMLGDVKVVEDEKGEQISVSLIPMVPTYKPPEAPKPNRPQRPKARPPRESFKDYMVGQNRRLRRLEGRTSPAP